MNAHNFHKTISTPQHIIIVIIIDIFFAPATNAS